MTGVVPADPAEESIVLHSSWHNVCGELKKGFGQRGIIVHYGVSIFPMGVTG
jgi:hypothetical protein